MLHIPSNISKSDLKATLSMAIEHQDNEEIKQPLDHPELELTPEEIFHYLHTAATKFTRMTSNVLIYLFSHPRIYSAFHDFSDDTIKQLWHSIQHLLDPKYVQSVNAGAIVEVIIFHTFIHQFKKNPEFTFKNAKNLLPGAENFMHPVFFEHCRKMASYPDRFFFYFGSEVISKRFFSEKSIVPPILKDESEDEHFVRCMITAFKHPLLRIALNVYTTEYQPLLELLLKNGKVNINQYEEEFGGDKETILHIAIRRKNVAVVRFLLSQEGIDLSIIDGYGMTLLHAAMQYYHDEIFQTLLQHPQMIKQIHTKNNAGNTPLHIGLSRGHIAACKTLLSLGFSEFDSVNENKQTPLHLIAESDRNAELIALFFEKFEVTKEFFNLKNSKGNTPFFVAADSGNNKLSEILLYDTRMDLTLTDSKGRTPLHIVVEMHNLEAVQFLLQQEQVNINAKTLESETSLHIAADHCIEHPELFFALFTHPKADVNAAYPQSQFEIKTVLHRALQTLRKAQPHQAIQFLNQYADLLFNDARIDTSFDPSFRDYGLYGLFGFAKKIDHIVTFKILIDRTRSLGTLLRFLPDPEAEPKEFALSVFMKESPQIVAYYAVLSLLKTNKELTYDQVFETLQQQAFPKWETWTDEQKLKAFYHAQRTLEIITPHVFAQVVFLSDGLLEIKKSPVNSNAPDTDSILGAKKFFRIASQLPLELQMTLCNAVGSVANQKGQVKEVIPKQDSGPAFKALGLTLNP